MNYIKIFLIAMLPVVELRGAIPVAISWNMNIVPSYIVAILGNMLPVPFIFLFARRTLAWGKDKKYIGKIFTYLYEKGHKAGEVLKKRAEKSFYIALMLFVAIPLPGTGAWTGTLGASILDLDFKKSTLAVLGGVLIAGVIMLLISIGFFKIF